MTPKTHAKHITKGHLSAQEQQTPVGDVDLPDWAPGHRVKSSGHRGDVDVPDWAPGHPSSRMGAHPSSQQERGQGYQRNQDVSPPPDARHDMAARCASAALMSGHRTIKPEVQSLEGATAASWASQSCLATSNTR